MKEKLATDKGAPDSARPRVHRDGNVLRRALEPGHGKERGEPYGRPILVVLSGLPGTGKTHFARELTRRVPFIVLESDRVRKLLVARPKYTPGEHSRVFEVCHLLLEEYLAAGRRVLFDATNLTESFRRPLYSISDRLSVPLCLVRFTAPWETIRRRLAERVAGMDPDNYSDAGWLIYCRLLPHEEPIRRRHFSVDSSEDICTVLEDVTRLSCAER
jgi:predicted kinase